MSTQETASSDYYDNDPEFLKALTEVAIDGEVGQTEEGGPSRQLASKRPRDPDSDKEGSDLHDVLSSVDTCEHNVTYLDNHTYGASRFGEFGEYMSRKRAKLQIQNAEMDRDEREGTPRIFKGLQIYVRLLHVVEFTVHVTNSSVDQWLDGAFRPELTGAHHQAWRNIPSISRQEEPSVRFQCARSATILTGMRSTHIIACALTPAKVRDFKHMKVVRPNWLVESAEAGQLLSWKDYIFRPGERVEATQGRKVGQQSLYDGLSSQGNVTARGIVVVAKRLLTAQDTQPIPGPSRTVDQATPVTPPRISKSDSDDSLHLTNPSTPEQAERVPGYSTHPSNLAAERAMADPAWRAAHTSAAPGFIEGYYKNSRLHHLSAWKAELKNLVAEAQESVDDGRAGAWGSGDGAVDKIVRENVGGTKGTGDDVSMRGAQLVMRPPGKGKDRAADDEERVIMHCDFDSFFVSAGLLDRPQLRGKPVVVCHSQGAQGGASSTSEIASASYEAREFGVKNGMRCEPVCS